MIKISYHGSNIVVKEPLASSSRKNLDFGPGFYTTSDFNQAVSWAKRKSKIENSEKVFKMSKELKFFILLLERYAYDKNMKTSDVLRYWDKKGITQEVYDSYFVYHQEALENAYKDIENLLETGKHLW